MRTRHAKIDCDRDGCTRVEQFSASLPPPKPWLVLEDRSLSSSFPRVATFCSMMCLATWAQTQAQAVTS